MTHRGDDDVFSALYARAVLDDGTDFVRERYREGIRWRNVVEALLPSSRRTVLDLGAGNGGISLAMAATGENRVLAADTLLNRTSHQLLGQAPLADSIVTDGVALPLRDGCIDVVLCLETIEHVPVAAVGEFAAEMMRVVRRGGLIVITTPPRWRFLLRGDPHFGIPGLLLVTPSWQRAIAARRGFSDTHHYVGRVYSSSAQIARLFPGFTLAVLSRSRAPQRWFWDALVLKRD